MDKINIYDPSLLKVLQTGFVDDVRIEKIIPGYQKGIVPVILLFSCDVKNKHLEKIKEMGFSIYYQHKLIPIVTGWGKVEAISKLCSVPNLEKIYLSHIHPENIPKPFAKKTILKMISKGIRKKLKIKIKKINNNMTPNTTKFGWQDQKKRITNDINSVELWKRGLTGAGVKIGIVDTGINEDMKDINLQNWLAWDKNQCEAKIVAKASFVPTDTDVLDKSGHGSGVVGLMTGTAAGSVEAGTRGRFPGIAPEAQIIAAKAFTYEGDPVLAITILAAMEWVIEQGADIVCMFHDNDSRPRMLNHDCSDEVLAMLIEAAARKKNVLFSFAGGNDGPYMGSILFPATSPFGITAGASCQRQDFISDDTESGFPQLGIDPIEEHFTGIVPFSARGPAGNLTLKPDVIIPGANIVMPYNQKGLQANRMKLGLPLKLMSDNDYLAASGTSVAAAALAGGLALLLQSGKKVLKDECTYYRLKAFLLNSCNNNIAECKWFKPIEELALNGQPKYGGETADPLSIGAGQLDLYKANNLLEGGICAYFYDERDNLFNPIWNIPTVDTGSTIKGDLRVFNMNCDNLKARFSIKSINWRNSQVKMADVSWFKLPESIDFEGKLENSVPIELTIPKEVECGHYYNELHIEVKKQKEKYYMRLPIFISVPMRLVDKKVLDGSIWTGNTADFEHGIFQGDWKIHKIVYDTAEGALNIKLSAKENSDFKVMYYDSNYLRVTPIEEDNSYRKFTINSKEGYLAITASNKEKNLKKYDYKLYIEKEN